MKCSIVITTYDKPESLDIVLSSIIKQKPPFDFEIIVVNDGPSYKTIEVCAKYYEHIKYLATGKEEYGNPAVARNVGYREARGDVILCQCDDVIHISDNVIERLVNELQPGEFLLSKTENWVYSNGAPVRYISDYCSPDKRSVPFFFCGTVLRKDLYAVGGNDEDFVKVCYDDNWFADCLIKGLGLKPRHSTDILTHHTSHRQLKGGRVDELESKNLYNAKVAEAKKTGVWQASSGPWAFNKQSIPKVMNFFWAGGEIPWLRYLTLKSFRELNPDWKVNLYSTEQYNLSELDIETKLWMPPVKNLSHEHASDVFQWELLSTDGGFYSDMDILYIKPVQDNWLLTDVLTCLSLGYMTIGFFGASPENTLFSDIYCEAIRRYNPREQQNTGACAVYRLGGLKNTWTKIQSPGRKAMEILLNKHRHIRYNELCQDTIYPWAWNKLECIWNRVLEVPPNTIGIHWFGGAKRSQEMCNLVTPGSINQYPCTLTNYAKRYL